MNFRSLVLSSILFIPTASFSQQVNTYQVCTTYAENYVPGYYDNYGNYIQGSINVQKYRTPCSPPNGSATVVQQQQPQYYRRRVCNPTAGAILGAGLASAITGNKYNYGGNYNNSRNYSYNRNGGSSSSSGGWNNYGSNSNGWTLFGAGLGALMFSC